jgi:ABC-type glucose/galactose transport system permease subunit
MAQKFKSFWSDFFSLDEAKISTLIILTIITIIFSLVMYYFRNDISDNLLSLGQVLILSIAGVNVASTLPSLFGKKNKQSNNNDKQDYGI